MNRKKLKKLKKSTAYDDSEKEIVRKKVIDDYEELENLTYMQQQQQQDMDQYFSDPSESEESDDSEKDFNDDLDYDINGKRGRNFAKQIKNYQKKEEKRDQICLIWKL